MIWDRNQPRRLFRALSFLALLPLLLAHASGVAQEAPSSSADGRPLTATVVDIDGKAVAGAEVWLTTNLGMDRGETKATKTDQSGRFAMVIPQAWLNLPTSYYRQLAMLVYKPGMRVWALGLPHGVMPPKSGMRITLRPAEEASLTILAHDEKPLSGATVTVQTVLGEPIAECVPRQSLQEGSQAGSELRAHALAQVAGFARVNLPETIKERFASRVGPDGKVTIPGVAREQIDGIEVAGEPSGRQHLTSTLSPAVASPTVWPDTVKLAAVGSVAGRLVAQRPELAAGSVVTIGSQGERDGLVRFGWADIPCDASGRFETAAIAEGRLFWSTKVPDTCPLRPQAVADGPTAIRAGELVELEIPLVPAVRVRGIVRQRRTGQPIAGLHLHVASANHQQERRVTDTCGRFEYLSAPGQTLVMPVPDLHYLPASREQLQKPMTIPPDVAEHELPPIELDPAAVVRGTVLDDAGDPVPEVLVEGFQYGGQERRMSNWIVDLSTTTDVHGRFAIEGVDPVQPLRLEAWTDGAITQAAVFVQPDKQEEVTLRISKSNIISLGGRVVDGSATPVAGAEVEIWLRPWMPYPNLAPPRKVEFDGAKAVRTDAEGRFQTPRELERGAEYRAVVQGAAVQAARTEWMQPSAAGRTNFPDLVAARVQTLNGRVADQQGRPVAGAKVFAANEAEKTEAVVTDAAGRFRLQAAVDDKTFLFVEKPEFRFTGRRIRVPRDAAEWTLTSTDEQPKTPMTTLPMALPHQQRLELARRLLAPVVEQAKAGGGDVSEKVRVLRVLVKIDPEETLDWIEREGFKPPELADMFRRSVALAFAEESLDEARALIESMKTFKSKGYLDVCQKLPDSKRADKRELISQAILSSQNLQGPVGMRLVAIAEAAEMLLDLGETEEGTKLLRENLEEAKKLPTAEFGGYARGAFAEELAQIDLPAALALVKDLKDEREFDRHHGNIAHELAARNPAEAERVLTMVRQQLQKDLYAVCVCYRMASVDLPRARRIAGAVHDFHLKAHAYGVMAEALVQSQPADAIKLLRRAFAALQEQVEAGRDQFDSRRSASSVAGALLPVAERIDARLVPEFLWRAVSFRMPRREDPALETVVGQSGTARADASNAVLATTIARYDRELARVIFDPFSEDGDSLRLSVGTQVIPPAVLIDPRRAAAAVEATQGASWPKLDAAALLARDDEQVWRAIYGFRGVGLWKIDQEDMGIGDD